MNDQFASAMDRALEQTRAGNPSEATRIIQAALAGRSTRMVELKPPSQTLVRRPLGQVVDNLARGRRFDLPLRRHTSAKPAIPVGATYEWRQHSCAFGRRDVRVFVPSEPTRISGLLLMLHGCSQDPDDFAVGTRMNELGDRNNFVVAYPAQTRTANQMACWNWFRPEDQRKDTGEPAFLADLATSLAEEYSVPERKIFAAGLSAGGAMAAILGAEYPDIFSAVGVHSGLAPGSARDLPSAYAAMRGTNAMGLIPARGGCPAIVFHGTADSTVAPANADAVVEHAIGEKPSIRHDECRGSGVTRAIHHDCEGNTLVENWRIPGLKHAWSGGAPEGSYTHPNGPDASAEMIRFFLTLTEDGRP